MGRRREIALAVVVAAAVSACGGSSSANGPAKLASGDVAVVGSTHITKAELAHQIVLEERSIELGAESCTGGSEGQEDCSTQKGTIPAKGTAAYTTTIVAPVVAYLVTNAQLHAIAQELSVVVTPKRVHAEIAANVQQIYGGDEAKYRADLTRFKLTAADVEGQVEFTLLQQAIDAKLKSQVTVTPADVREYYNSHKQLYETSANSRRVDYVLLASRAAAEKAHAELAAGKSFSDVSRRALDDSSRHEPFVATGGEVDAAFGAVAFSLPTNRLSPLVPVDKAYVTSRPTLRGKCKPTCYFIIRPTARTIRGGTQKSFASVRAQIASQLGTVLPQTHSRLVIARLEKKQRKLTRYARGYAPPRSTTPSTGVPDTDDTTAPTT